MTRRAWDEFDAVTGTIARVGFGAAVLWLALTVIDLIRKATTR